MKKGIPHISAETLRTWLDENKPVFILDVRPKDQREEWKIPGSQYVDAYKRLKSGDMYTNRSLRSEENTSELQSHNFV